MFEAAARHRRFTHAAREFNITQPAISRAIIKLEEFLGTPLFKRSSAGLELTEVGEQLFIAVREGFDRIESTIREIKAAQEQADVVTLSVTSAFAMFWLMPRFDRFRQEVPDVSLHLNLIHGEPIGDIGNSDIAMRYSKPDQDGLETWLLAKEIVIPVCSPSYLAQHGPIDSTSGLDGHVLASLSGKMRVPWTRFAMATQLGSIHNATELVFNDYAVVLQGTIKGQAVALGWWHVIAGELISKGLVPAGTRAFETGESFYLASRQSANRRQAVQRARAWIQNEFEQLDPHLSGLDLTLIGD